MPWRPIDKTMQIHQLIKQASGRLAASDTPRLDSEILLAAVLNTDRAAIYAHADAAVPEPCIEKFNTLIDKRAADWPVAYLTGHKEFWSLDFKVNQHTLIPRPETECLVETALDLLADNQHPRILELGTGSGAIAIAIAREKPGGKITATDIDPLALQIATDNARRHNAANIDFLHCCWFQGLEGEKFDLILSNPPYLGKQDAHLCRQTLQYEPAGALLAGEHGLEALTHIIGRAADHLHSAAMILLEHGFNQSRPVRALYRRHGYQSVTTVQDYAGLDRISFACSIRKQPPPIC